MNDLFNFLKNLVQNEPEVIAAFVMGAIVALLFLAFPIYKLAAWFHGGIISTLEGEQKKTVEQLQETQQELAEAKKKSKERKTKLEEKQKEIDKLNQSIEETKRDEAKANETLNETRAENDDLNKQVAFQRNRYVELVPKYNKLVSAAKVLKKQLANLDEQAKLAEKLQVQLWDVPVDKTKIAPFRPLKRNGPVIIAVTNLKGGVGKTTITANLAVTYCKQAGKRVLIIDLDFQASLTNLCLSQESVRELSVGHGRLVDNVFKGSSAEAAKIAFANTSQTLEPKLNLLAASENLANIEERAKARWLTEPGNADVRSLLRYALHDPIFQEHFDVILIDCPPRWTTSSINAIACCDYVLIPTQLDRVSTEAVPRLLKWLRYLKTSSSELYGNFRILGVLANRAYPRSGLIAQEREIWTALPANSEKAWAAPVHHFGTIIHDKSEFRRAANKREFAALHSELTLVFQKLVQEIDDRRRDHESS